MRISNEEMGRLAVSSIVAVMGFIVLNKACGLIPDVIIWWLLYAIGSGVVLNTEQGERPATLMKLSILPAIVPVLMLVFFTIVGIDLCLSLPSPWIILMLPIVSWVSIFIFSFARAPISQFVSWVVTGGSVNKINKVITAIQIIISGVAAIALSLSLLGG